MHGLAKRIAVGAVAGVTLWPGVVQEHPLTPALTYATWEASYPGFNDCGTPGLMADRELQSAIARGELPSYFQIPERRIRELN